MSEPPVAHEWPWPRLLLLSLGSGLSMVGSYVIIFRLFEVGFEMSGSYAREPFIWGGLALVAGLFLLGVPWWDNGPMAKFWRGEK